MSALLAVLRKELRDHLRDRRALTSAVMMPLIGPLTLFAMFSALVSWTRQDTPLVVPVMGETRAPTLVKFLVHHGARVITAPPDYEALVRSGDLDLALVIPEDYAEDFAAGRSASVQLVVDNSRNRTRVPVRRAQALLQAYAQQLAALRLVARGVSPQVAAPVRVAELDVATPQKQGANLLGMIPLFLIMVAFMGGMHLAIDATAGERERGTLEPLLLNPVRRGAVVAGKWVASVLVTWVACGVSLLAFLLVLRRLPLQDLGVRLTLGPSQIAGLLAAVLPLALFSTAVQMLLAIFARSFKEAQTYISLIMLVPMIPGMLVNFYPMKTTLAGLVTPALGQTLLMSDLLRGEPLGAAAFLLAGLGCALAALLCLLVTTRLLASERIVFGR